MKFLFITHNDNISFGKQSRILATELSKKGHNVAYIYRTISDELKYKTIDTFRPDIVVLWTFFDRPLYFKHRDFYLVGFEVSDTNKLSEEAIEIAKEVNPDIIITPSKWSKSGFSGINIPIDVIPHAIDHEIYNLRQIQFGLLRNNKKKVYLYDPYKTERKGIDIALYAVNKACISEDFFVIYKTWFTMNSNIMKIKCNRYIEFGHYDKKLHYSVMNYADIFLYPTRGGAFEIVALEMLAMGKTVVIPEAGAVSEIPLDKNDVYWIKIDGLKRYLFDNPFHVGEFVEPNAEDTYEKLKQALKEPKTFDKKKYLDYYSPSNIAEMFINTIRK